MDDMLSGMTWEEELNLLTKFHENNLGPPTYKDVHSEGEIIKKPEVSDALAPVGDGKAGSLGRGSKISTQDESLIVKQRGSVFSSKTSTKNESDASLDKKSPPIASTPTHKEGGRI